ncbi:MAG: hypothetical protein WCJ81_02970 [bacterium]
MEKNYYLIAQRKLSWGIAKNILLVILLLCSISYPYFLFQDYETPGILYNLTRFWIVVLVLWFFIWVGGIFTPSGDAIELYVDYLEAKDEAKAARQIAILEAE